MKLIKLTFGLLAFYVLLFTGTAPFAGCTKTIYDTIIKKDTVRVHDTTACGNLTEGLVAYFPFTNGSLKDSSGKNNDIYSNTAVAVADRFGKANSAFDFNSLNHVMKIRSSTTLNPAEISIMAIVKPTGFYSGTCHSNTILSKGSRDDVQGFYYLRFQDSASNCVPGQAVRTTKEFFSGGFGDNSPIGKGAGAGIDTSFIATNQWHTVIYTFDGIVSKLYVNGQLKDVKLKKVTFTGNNNDIYIGRNESVDFPYPFTGVLDELRIYNKALCPEQVTALSNLKQ